MNASLSIIFFSSFYSRLLIWIRHRGTFFLHITYSCGCFVIHSGKFIFIFISLLLFHTSSIIYGEILLKTRVIFFSKSFNLWFCAANSSYIHTYVFIHNFPYEFSHLAYFCMWWWWWFWCFTQKIGVKVVSLMFPLTKYGEYMCCMFVCMYTH